MLEELGYYISRGLLENGKALANLANLVLPAVLTACDLADVNKHVDIHEATNQTKEYNLATSDKPFTIRKAAQESPMHPELLPWEHEKEEPIYSDENFINYVRGAQYVYTKGINRFQMINGKLRPLTIAKTSITSKLAQRTEETQVTLPEEYAKYAEVFSEEAVTICLILCTINHHPYSFLLSLQTIPIRTDY